MNYIQCLKSIFCNKNCPHLSQLYYSFLNKTWNKSVYDFPLLQKTENLFQKLYDFLSSLNLDSIYVGYQVYSIGCGTVWRSKKLLHYYNLAKEWEQLPLFSSFAQYLQNDKIPILRFLRFLLKIVRHKNSYCNWCNKPINCTINDIIACNKPLKIYCHFFTSFLALFSVAQFFPSFISGVRF